jgi:hypothetical protein
LPLEYGLSLPWASTTPLAVHRPQAVMLQFKAPGALGTAQALDGPNRMDSRRDGLTTVRGTGFWRPCAPFLLQ